VVGGLFRLGSQAEQRLHGLLPTHSEGDQDGSHPLQPKATATRWNISEATLERRRSEGIGPRFLKLGGRVLYRQVDIEAYEESCLATVTGICLNANTAIVIE
jgi:hypothetical protein